MVARVKLVPLLAGLSVLAGSACADRREAAAAPTATAERLARWSDPATWPGGRLPAAGADVEIAASASVLLDVSPPAIRALHVAGRLVFDERDLALTAAWIDLRGALEVGTERAPFGHRAVITLTGADSSLT